MIKYVYASPLGELTLVSNGEALVALVFEGHWKTIPAVVEAREGEDAITRETARQLGEYFAGKRETFDLKLAPQGGGFQQKVWRALQALRIGETATYSALAQTVGSAPRAVGTAVGRNPISIIIPCHRVLGAGGSLTGYAGGLERKRFLLAREGVSVRDNAQRVA